MENVAEPAQERQKCPLCDGGPVILALYTEGRIAILEECKPGRGRMALQTDMLGSLPRVVRVRRGTSVRLHVCPRRSGLQRP